MIVAHRLTKQFGRFLAVDALDFDIPAGEVVGFLGPNGAGKTTTIRMIAGFLPPTSGSVTIDGVPVWRHRLDVAGRIGYLPESAPLYPEMRVREYLKFRCRLYGLPRSEHAAAIDRAVRRCWLEEVRRKPIHQLSKGYRQRVGLAAAMLHDPDVLILDEPTSGLDPRQIREVRNLIREIAGRQTVLLSSHILPEVEQTCDRVLMIARGRVRLSGTIDELEQRAMRQSVRYVVETNQPNAKDRIGRVSAVTSVDLASSAGTWNRMTVVAKAGSADLREEIATALNGDGGVIRELRRERLSLEQLFVQAVTDAEREPAA